MGDGRRSESSGMSPPSRWRSRRHTGEDPEGASGDPEPPATLSGDPRLQDSLTGEQRDFVPVTPGKVGIYICGLTTRAPPHLGHVRYAVAFDVLRRWLTRGHGYDVTLIRNVTDIDDKILAKSAESGGLGMPWYATGRDRQGVGGPRGAPADPSRGRQAHYPEMVALMETIIEKGHAYPAADGSGDVYFDVRSWPTYGALTKQRSTT